MTEANGPDRPHHDPIDPVDNAGRPGRSGQKRGRVIVPATIVGIIVVIFAVILGVSQCAAPDNQSEGAPAVTVSVPVSVHAGPAGG